MLDDRCEIPLTETFGYNSFMTDDQDPEILIKNDPILQILQSRLEETRKEMR